MAYCANGWAELHSPYIHGTYGILVWIQTSLRVRSGWADLWGELRHPSLGLDGEEGDRSPGRVAEAAEGPGDVAEALRGEPAEVLRNVSHRVVHRPGRHLVVQDSQRPEHDRHLRSRRHTNGEQIWDVNA
eukprot:scaffold38146_cov25-Prasinocladus_malaysianus.AAC.1